MEFDDYVTDLLTESERKVVYWLVLGLTNDQIAEKVFLCKQSVKYHLVNLFDKFGAVNRTNLAYILGKHVIKDERF